MPRSCADFCNAAEPVQPRHCGSKRGFDFRRLDSDSVHPGQSAIRLQFNLTSSSSNSSQTQDPINQDFQTLANAISSNQVAAAQSAWTQIQSDLASNGITNLSDGKAATAELLAQTQASITQQIVSDALDASRTIDSGTGLSSSLISSWLTYQDGGSATSLSSAGNTGSILDTSA